MEWFLYDNGFRHERVKTINSCFATYFFLRIIFLHKEFLLFNIYIMKCFFGENIWQNDNKKMFLSKIFLVSPELSRV